MGRDAVKACENQCFRCRKEAAKHNDKLGSREGAAELLGISVSSLADYELGNTKVIPVDKVVLMADIYNAPELMAWYARSTPAAAMRRLRGHSAKSNLRMADSASPALSALCAAVATVAAPASALMKSAKAAPAMNGRGKCSTSSAPSGTSGI